MSLTSEPRNGRGLSVEGLCGILQHLNRPYEAETEQFTGCFSRERRSRTTLFLGSHPRMQGEFVSPYEAVTGQLLDYISLKHKSRTALFLGSRPRMRGEFVLLDG